MESWKLGVGLLGVRLRRLVWTGPVKAGQALTSSIESVRLAFFFTTITSVLVVSLSGPRSLRLSAALCLSELSWLALFFATRSLAAFRCSTRAFRRASCSSFA